MVKHARKTSKKEEADKPVGYIVTEHGLLVESEEGNTENRPRRKEHKSLLDSLYDTENPTEKSVGNKKRGSTQDSDFLSTQTRHLQERRRSSLNPSPEPGDGSVLTGRRRSSAARAMGLVEAQHLEGRLRKFWAVVMVSRALAAMSAPRRRRLVNYFFSPFTSLYLSYFYNLGKSEHFKTQRSHHAEIDGGHCTIQARNLTQ